MQKDLYTANRLRQKNSPLVRPSTESASERAHGTFLQANASRSTLLIAGEWFVAIHVASIFFGHTRRVEPIFFKVQSAIAPIHTAVVSEALLQLLQFFPVVLDVAVVNSLNHVSVPLFLYTYTPLWISSESLLTS